MRGNYLWLPLIILGLTLILVACGTPTPERVEVTVEVPVTVVPEDTGEGIMSEVTIPFLEAWEGSGHADASAEAFVHWDEDGAIPASCAKCHSALGYQDYVGADGSAVGSLESETYELGTVVSCVACHNSGTVNKTSVVMPSGVEITGLGPEARCMECHQGRESTVSVNASIEEAGVGDDEVSEDLGFRNIHYYAAAATKYGTVAKGGYEYEGKTYDANFAHVETYNTCVECHSPHTLEVKVDECAACHAGVSSVEDLADVRMPGSLVDYDGDGDLEEGIAFEIQGLQETLLTAIQDYATATAGSDIAYDSAAYPYWFDGAGEGFASWTPRLLRAAYNYQVSQKDPGTFAHGGKYIIQLLYDSIEDLGGDVAGLHRNDHGHFAGSEEAFRHWDEDGAVPASCSKCHSADGLPLFLTEGGVTITQPTANGFQCSTCHDSLTDFTFYATDEVTFPSGATLTFGEGETANMCLNCHQGRQSGPGIAAGIESAAVGDDEVSEALRFQNPHYFAAGATLFGSDANGAYQYPGETYIGRFEHVDNFNTCVACHDAHALQVNVTACSGCHPGVESKADLETLRHPNSAGTDYDGDGDAEEGLKQEMATMQEALYAAIQAYATTNTAGAAIEYNPARYPYWFNDAGEQFASWTPTLVRATYNYTWSLKDPGSYAHNGKYMLQILYDTLEEIGGSGAVTGMTRP